MMNQLEDILTGLVVEVMLTSITKVTHFKDCMKVLLRLVSLVSIRPLKFSDVKSLVINEDGHHCLVDEKKDRS